MTRTGAVFTTPWTLRINPHLDQARESALAWMRHRVMPDWASGLLVSAGS
ncbi:hypothetical protein [Streptomyces diastatochromogenes]|nr:hypothetical protein [Streptomyces diastatochromogenes]MCZ0990614.1 hypothetical protein [Streptomyces diastatochromogenes]